MLSTLGKTSLMANFMTLFQRKGMNLRSLNLYDSIESLPVQIFFKILETENVNLLNPEKRRVSQQKLNEIWQTIREEYYKQSNPIEYKAELSRAKRITLLKIEIACCTAAVTYFELFNEILPAFKEFGYTVKDAKGVARVKQKMLVRKTKLTLLTPSLKEKDKKEVVNFYDMVADVQSTMNQLNILSGEINIEKTTVAKWISYIKSIKKVNDRQNKKR